MRSTVLIMAALAGCATPPPPAPPPAPAGPVINYDVSAPAGFALFEHPIMRNLYDAGGIAFLEVSPVEAEDAFRASIIVSPLTTRPGFDPAAPGACQTLYERVVEAGSAPVKNHSIVEHRLGKTCRWEMGRPDWKNRMAIATLLPASSDTRSMRPSASSYRRDSMSIASARERARRSPRQR